MRGAVRYSAQSEYGYAICPQFIFTKLHADPENLQLTEGLLRLADLMKLPVEGPADFRDLPHEPVSHPQLRHLDSGDPAGIFQDIRRGDLLVHMPYHSFDMSTGRHLPASGTAPRRALSRRATGVH